MLLEEILAKDARQRGVPGMTHLGSGYHKVKGTYQDLIDWFREHNLFIGVDYVNGNFIAKATVMSTGELRYTSTDPSYYQTLYEIIEDLLKEMPIRSKIRM